MATHKHAKKDELLPFPDSFADAVHRVFTSHGETIPISNEPSYRNPLLKIMTGGKAPLKPRNYHVVPNQGQWVIIREGDDGIVSVHNSQDDAIRAGANLMREESSNLIVHGRSGNVLRTDSRGNDPCPPKD